MTNDGGPAFPLPIIETRDGSMEYPADTRWGMSLRDYFAAQALSVLNYHNILSTAMNDREAELQIQNAVALSYRLADAMLKAREEPR